MPTAEQFVALLRTCLTLSDFYTPIYLVRVDERTGNLVILAGEEVEVEIFPDGRREIR
ncbi:DUF6888 family protein [Gloeobacter morelensis]|uniref:DUF6888 domain-containing protein n=1 Tax=Gloeobacter morelensis MG652769 TaxID=2781736 RepID=A0ABY3PKC1_9CYAN|nr:hypothetical protein [Gloeobacter morelensis]UFP94101.1 hypothetical protein ISF26_20420 [Gloeobacter morelensis MG652769]